MEKKVAEILVESLEKLGVQRTFGMPGSQNLLIYDCLLNSNIKNTLITNELFGTFMGCGYSLVTGQISVCFSIAGPGFTNMFSGLAEALLGSIPLMVFVTGVEKGTKSFQIHEINQIEAARPLVKDVFILKEGKQISSVVFKAAEIATSGEPGPVVVEIPKNFYKEKVVYEEEKDDKKNAAEACNEKTIEEIAALINESRCCGVYVGRGAACASKEIMEMAEKISSPVATTVSGKGVIPDDHPLAAGFGFGIYGTEAAERIFSHCDCLLAIGCKFSEIATGEWGLRVPENSIHIDINEKVLAKNYKTKISLCSDAKTALGQLLPRLHKKERNGNVINEIKKSKNEHIQKVESIKTKGAIHPAKFFHALRKFMERDAVFVTDCGYHQVWAITDFEVFEPRSFVCSADYQAMGFAIPAAIGAKIACPQRDVVCVCGDGCFLMSSYELLTAVRENLNIRVFIFNDNGLGLIKDQQKKLYDRVNSVDFINPDFAVLTKSLSVEYVEIRNEETLQGDLARVFSVEGKPVVVNVKIDYTDEPRYVQGMKKILFSKLPMEEKFAGIIKALAKGRSTMEGSWIANKKGQLLINGKWMDSEKNLESLNPATGEVIGKAAVSGEKEVAESVQASRMALSKWKKLGVGERARFLKKMAGEIMKNSQEISQLITTEVGRPLFESGFEVSHTASIVNEIAEKGKVYLEGEAIPINDIFLKNKFSFTVFEPIGVVGVIKPWNMPLALPFWTIASALIGGNTVIFKPSELAPFVGTKIGEIGLAAGLPEGVLNIVTGDDKTGECLVNSDIDMISFTGSAETGKKIMERSAKKLHRISLELGGSNPFIVFNDANLEEAMNGAVWGRFANCGQLCGSAKRIYVQKGISDQFIKGVVEKTRNLIVGNGLNFSTEIGPLASLRQRDKIMEQIKDAVDKGAKVECGARIPENQGKGYFYEPTVLTNVTSDMQVLNEEVFGPVMVISIFNELEEAIDCANKTQYGLGASIWTGNLDVAMSVSQRLACGMVYINEVNMAYAECPWGGIKNSGMGTSLSKYGVREFVHVKHINMDYSTSTTRPWWFPYKK